MYVKTTKVRHTYEAESYACKKMSTYAKSTPCLELDMLE